MLVRSRPLNMWRSDWSFDRAFDDLVDSFFSSARFTPEAPRMASTWEDGVLKLTVDLPGIPQDAVDVSVAGRALTISVKTDTLSWERTLSLGTGLDPEQVSAQYDNGRLTVRVRPVAEAQPRRIEIEAATPTPAIEAGETAGQSDSDAETSATA